MMIAVWKFTIEPDTTSIEIPGNCRLLSVAFQGEELRLWAAVDPSSPIRKRRLKVVGTGHEYSNLKGVFIGTAFHPGGLVFHVFDQGFAHDHIN